MNEALKITLIGLCILSFIFSFAAFYIASNAITKTNANTENIEKLQNDMRYIDKVIENKQDTIVINTYLNIKK